MPSDLIQSENLCSISRQVRKHHDPCVRSRVNCCEGHINNSVNFVPRATTINKHKKRPKKAVEPRGYKLGTPPPSDSTQRSGTSSQERSSSFVPSPIMKKMCPTCRSTSLLQYMDNLTRRLRSAASRFGDHACLREARQIYQSLSSSGHLQVFGAMSCSIERGVTPSGPWSDLRLQLSRASCPYQVPLHEEEPPVARSAPTTKSVAGTWPEILRDSDRTRMILIERGS